MRLRRKKAVERLLAKPTRDDKDSLWSWLKDHYDLGVELRSPFEQRWLIDMAFYVGRQYTFFNQSAWILQQLRMVKGRIRNVDNQLLPRVRRQIADSIRHDPVMSVVPHSTDDEDIKSAKIGDKVLRAKWRDLKMKKKLRKMNTWKFITGNAFLDDRWNPRIGPMVFDEKTSKMVYQGDVDVDVWSPLEILVPYAALGEDELNDFPWMIKHKFRQLDWIIDFYKEAGKKVKAESLPKNYFDTGYLFGEPSGSAKMKAEGAVVMELYKRPCSDYPKGIFIAGANGIILNKQDYPFSDYSLEHFKDIEVPGVFWGMATMELGIQLQKTWNRTISGIDEFNRLLGKGKGLVPRGAKLEALPDDTHGEWLQYKPVMGHKPEIMTMKSLPQTYSLILEITRSSLQDLFSQQEVTRGTNKSDIRSGEMVDILLEQNSIGGIPSYSIQEEGMESLFSRILKRIQKGYDTDRILQVTGREGEFDVFPFKGSDLRNNTDVHVKRESSLPESRVARSAIIERRYKEGFYGDPADPEVRRNVQNMLDDSITENIYEDVKLDETNARVENMTLTQTGITSLLVNHYDDHQIHVKEHNHFRKSREYQQLKMENIKLFVELDTVFQDHIQQHQVFIQQMMEAQIATQERIKGGGK